jgi:putative peptidoglycan lipid II flippase
LTAWGWNDDLIEKTAPLTAINFWYLDLIFIVTFAATLLQYKEHFATTALATALLNISMIAALWFFMKHDPATVAYALSFAVVAGGLLQVLVHLYALHRFKLDRVLALGWKYRKKKDVSQEITHFNKLFFPSVLGNAVPQLSSFIDTLLATFIAAGSVSYLFYANRVFQLPLALIAIATSVALFPSVAKALKNGREDEAKASMTKAFWLLLFLLGLATLGGIIFAEPIVWLLFERGKFTHAETLQTAFVLQMYMIGLVPYGLAKLFSLYLYAAHRHTDAAKVAVVSLVVTVTASLIFMYPLQAAGLALAGSLGGWTLFFFTVRKTGTTMFFSMLKHRYALYFVAVMLVAGVIFYAAAAYIDRFIS